MPLDIENKRIAGLRKIFEGIICKLVRCKKRGYGRFVYFCINLFTATFTLKRLLINQMHYRYKLYFISFGLLEGFLYDDSKLIKQINKVYNVNE